MEDDLYITQLISRDQSTGIASQPAVEKTRTALVKLDLIEEYEQLMELTKKTRLYLRLTSKGRKVAKMIKGVTQILSEEI
jgi:hypothetical protein